MLKKLLTVFSLAAIVSISCCTISAQAQPAFYAGPSGKAAAPEERVMENFVPTPVPKPAPFDINDRPEYHMRWRVDAPIIAAGTVWTLYAFTEVYNKPKSDSVKIARLDKNDLLPIDRWGAGKNDDKASEQSDLFFYGSIPLPVLLFLDRKIRKDAGKVALLYWETMAVTGTLYTGATFVVDRYRPEAYDVSIPVGERTDGNYKNSFFAGHVALVASTTFFTASIYDEYHPHSPFRWVLWGGATAVTGYTAYLRHIAGKHFPTDIILGAAIGTMSGIFVPKLHKTKSASGHGWVFRPDYNWTGGMGVAAAYHF